MNEGKDFYTEKVEAKHKNYMIGYSLSTGLIWKNLVGSLWLIALRF